MIYRQICVSDSKMYLQNKPEIKDREGRLTIEKYLNIFTTYIGSDSLILITLTSRFVFSFVRKITEMFNIQIIMSKAEVISTDIN